MGAFAAMAERLSVLEEKREQFLTDIDFRESADDAARLLGAGAAEAFRSLGIVLLKPDAILSGQGGPAVSIIAELGAELIDARRIRLDARTIRSMWRYQLRFASVDRIQVFDDFFALAECVALVYADRSPAPDVPLSVRLSDLKGTTTRHKRRPTNLRSRLDSPNRLFSLVHCADEPIDVARELAVLYSGDARSSLFAKLGGGLSEAEAKEVEEEARRLAEIGGAAMPMTVHDRCAAALEERFAATRKAAADAPVRYRSVRQALAGAGAHEWCLMLWCAERIAFNEEELRFVKPFGRAGVDVWLSRIREEAACGS